MNWWLAVICGVLGGAAGFGLAFLWIGIVSGKTIRRIRTRVQERTATKAQAGNTYEERLRAEYKRRGLTYDR